MSSPNIKHKNGLKFKVGNPSEKPMWGPPPQPPPYKKTPS